jgi:peptidoglycan/xylan/chitin deacetylase (PgdA/CDA1 family)
MRRRWLKNAALRSFRSAGLFRISANSRNRRSSLLILCYHGVALKDEHIWRPGLYVTAERFMRRLEMLQDFRANVLPFTEAVARLRAGSLPEKSVAITFDDGFFDFEAQAWPALQRFGYPSTVYLTTHYCKYKTPIFNLITSYMFSRSGRQNVDLHEFGGRVEPASIRTEPERQAVVDALMAWSRRQNLDTPAKDDVARALASRLGFDYDALLRSRILQILSPDEVANLARSGVAIELHTHRHRTPRDRDLFIREIRDNKTRIREYTGREPIHFCYPSGDYAAEFLPWLRDCGVESATTCERGLAKIDSDPLLLPRLLDQDDIEDLVFESWLAGFGL